MAIFSYFQTRCGHDWTMTGPWLDHDWTMTGPWLDHGDHGDRGEVPSHELFSSCQLLLDGLPFPPNDGNEAVVLGALLAAAEAAESSAEPLGEMALERLAAGWGGALGMIFLMCMMYIYIYIYNNII